MASTVGGAHFLHGWAGRPWQTKALCRDFPAANPLWARCGTKKRGAISHILLKCTPHHSQQHGIAEPEVSRVKTHNRGRVLERGFPWLRFSSFLRELLKFAPAELSSPVMMARKSRLPRALTVSNIRKLWGRDTVQAV